jgi:hypothetical protein
MTLFNYCQENNIIIKTPVIDTYPYLVFWRILKGENIATYIYPFGYENIYKGSFEDNELSYFHYNLLIKLKKQYKKSKLKMANELSFIFIMTYDNNYNNFKINDDYWCYMDNSFQWKIIPRNEWKKIYLETRLKQYNELLQKEELLKKLDDEHISFEHYMSEEYEKTNQQENYEETLKYFEWENKPFPKTLKERRRKMVDEYVFY